MFGLDVIMIFHLHNVLLKNRVENCDESTSSSFQKWFINVVFLIFTAVAQVSSGSNFKEVAEQRAQTISQGLYSVTNGSGMGIIFVPPMKEA